AEYDGDGTWRGADGLTAWRAVASTGWTPVKGLDVMLDGSYSSVDGSGTIDDGDAWAVNLWLKRSW
ncbi:MAG: porin, partial [Rhizobiales bacterium]|nr:porin [Hyphomicrobiales bacterium]